ncbi:MAG: cell filamentation protein Fic [Acidobacteriales bacterium 59-55]|nr:Fic family protein [Terriglobales bacterium]OJV43772.1 MAG: cell filamentation protein Fic [Acidobacteriales bacterium 59-55]
MADGVRHSQANEAEIITDPVLRAQREAANALKQYELVAEMVQAFVDPERPFRFRPSHLQSLHRAALLGLSGYAGNWRPAGVRIGESKHQPPDAFQVPERIEELCDYVNENWHRSALHLASYVMWKLNWIHPFTDGNGRTSRAASYLILCVRMGYLLPGRLTIPEQIEADKTPYYRALEAADVAWSEGKIDVSKMKELLSSMLAAQLVGVHGDSESGDE